jgi:hypothetical protein
VSELNLGASDDYQGEGLRTCSDARFCHPIVPGSSHRRLPSPDRESRRWPLSSRSVSNNPANFLTCNEAYYADLDDKAFREEFDTGPFVSTEVDRAVAAAKFYHNGGQIIPLEESVLVVLPSK